LHSDIFEKGKPRKALMFGIFLQERACSFLTDTQQSRPF